MRVSEFCQICGHSYKEHTEEVNQILNANRGEKKTKSKSSTKERVTAEEIVKLQTELFKMKNFGTNLRSIDKKKL